MGAAPARARGLSERTGREIAYLADSEALASPRATDFVLLEAGVIPPDGWLEVLADVAHSALGDSHRQRACAPTSH